MMVRKHGSPPKQRRAAVSAKFVIVVTFVLLQMISRTTAQPNNDSRKGDRVLQQEETQEIVAVVIMGSCTFMNQWTGETCMEFHGDGWTPDSMAERCGAETDGVQSPGGGCPKPSGFAGFCSKPAEGIDGATEATAMMITPTSDCSFNAMACGSFLSGTFDPSPACADESDGDAETASSAPNEAPPMGGAGASWSGGGGGGGPSRDTNTACDTSPGALTDALSKLLDEKKTTTTTEEEDGHYSRVVDHTCVDSTGYTGKRCFYTYIPECATVDSPLVYDIHGVSLCPLWNFETSGWIQKAIDNCFVVVWPVGNLDPKRSAFSCFALEGGYDVTEAANQHETTDEEADAAIAGIEYETEDCCCFSFNGPRLETSVFDDKTFLRNIAAVVVDAVPERTKGVVTIDAKRIYMGGHSNGCTAGLSMAATHSDMVAAVCCHSPALISPFPDDYEPVPIWLVHGKMDGTVPYDGAFPDGSEEPKYNPGAEQMNSLIGAANGCTTTSSKAGADDTPTSNGVYTYHNQENCGGDAAVRLLSLDTAGHTPFRNADLFMGDYDEAVVATVDTTQHAWDFCSGYSKSIEPVLELVTPFDAADSGNNGSDASHDAKPDGPTRQDVIDAWKEANSVYAESSSSTPPVQNGSALITFLSALFVAAAL